MLSLYEILKASKTGIAPDLWTRLAADKMAGDSGKVRELTGELPLTFTANGKPLIDYTIYGNMAQSKECGERTRNLFDKDNADIADLYPDATTREIKQSSNLSTWSIVLPVEPSTTYTFTMGEATTAIRRRVGMCSDYPTKGAYCTSVDDTPEYDHPNLGNIFTTDADTRYVLIMYVSGAGRDVAIERANRVQVVKGNTALPYEPYGYKLPISSAGQTNNIYLGEVETTRYVKQLVLTGEENWIYDSNGSRCYINITDAYAKGDRRTQCYCSHYICVYNGEPFNTVPNHSIYINLYNNAARFYIKNEEFTSAADFKSFFAQQYAAGTPVTIWYILATPETVTINEPIRKIGNYADTVSMEQTGVQIPTVEGSTVIDVETELKPSEMYIKYKG